MAAGADQAPGPKLFEKEQSFDFGQSFTNITPELPQWKRHYAHLAAKFHSAAYVGEKMTEFLFRFQRRRRRQTGLSRRLE